ncbi:MAG: DUF3090 domain-containing protein [Chloroflexota bacterium]
MSRNIADYNSVSRITIDALGSPGQRIFLLQASQGSSMITLKLEKEQARALATSIIELLEDLDEKYPRPQSKLDEPLSSDLLLREPMEPIFAIGQIGLGYERGQDLIVLVVQEIQTEENQELTTARFWATRAQMEALSDHTLEVVERGRPICPLCNSPMDPEGHFCPRSNGHDRVEWT